MQFEVYLFYNYILFTYRDALCYTNESTINDACFFFLNKVKINLYYNNVTL